MGEENNTEELTEDMKNYAEERTKYQALCRGEMAVRSDIAKRYLNVAVYLKFFIQFFELYI